MVKHCWSARFGYGLAVAGTALVILAVVYYAQYHLLLVPCPLCLWDRWPYRLLVIFGLILMIAPKKTVRYLYCMVLITALVGAGLSFVHVGVEFKWWLSPLPECNAALYLSDLPAAPAKPCDDPTYLVSWLPISMAMMSLIYMVGLYTFSLSWHLMVYLRRMKTDWTPPAA